MGSQVKSCIRIGPPRYPAHYPYTRSGSILQWKCKVIEIVKTCAECPLSDEVNHYGDYGWDCAAGPTGKGWPREKGVPPECPLLKSVYVVMLRRETEVIE